jgi:hypothetical protein
MKNPSAESKQKTKKKSNHKTLRRGRSFKLDKKNPKNPSAESEQKTQKKE